MREVTLLARNTPLALARIADSQLSSDLL